MTGSQDRWSIARLIVIALVFLCFFRLTLASARADGAKQGPLKIGIQSSFYRHVSESSEKTATESFKRLMKREINRDGDVSRVDEPAALAQQIADGKLDIGVFHGFEYAWVYKQHPELKPLMAAVNQRTDFRALILVQKTSTATDFAALKGKTFGLTTSSGEEARFFLERLCRKAGQEEKDFFAKVTTPATLEDALDDVVDNAVQATVATAVGLETYKKRKPARFKKLKILIESDLFPCSVVVYRPGGLDEATAASVRKGLTHAADTADGREMLTQWKLTGFEPVPKHYEELLQGIEKAFPAPK